MRRCCQPRRRSKTRQRRGSPRPSWPTGRGAAKKVRFPILFCVSNTDTVTPPAQTLRYARTAPLGEIKRYDAGHFDFYIGEAFEELVRDQVEFLARQLHPVPATEATL